MSAWHQLPARPAVADNGRDRRLGRWPVSVGTGGAVVEVVVEPGRRPSRVGRERGGPVARLAGGVGAWGDRSVQGADRARVDHEPVTGSGTPGRGAGVGEGGRAD